MGHEEISKRLSAYVDGEVSVEERAVIETHLAECGICATIVAGIREVSALVRGAQFGRIDAAAMKRLHEHVENLSKRGAERFAWALSAVAACIAIGASLQLFMPATQAQTATVTAPDAWEGAAVQLTSTNDEAASAGNNNGELAMAQWMVADLNSGETRGQ